MMLGSVKTSGTICVLKMRLKCKRLRMEYFSIKSIYCIKLSINLVRGIVEAYISIKKKHIFNFV